MKTIFVILFVLSLYANDFHIKSKEVQQNIANMCKTFTHLHVTEIEQMKPYNGNMDKASYVSLMSIDIEHCYYIYRNYPYCDFDELTKSKFSMFNNFAGLEVMGECRLDCIEQYFAKAALNPDDPTLPYEYLKCSHIGYEVSSEMKEKIITQCETYIHIDLTKLGYTQGSTNYSLGMVGLMPKCLNAYRDYPNCDYSELVNTGIETLKNFTGLSAMGECRLD